MGAVVFFLVIFYAVLNPIVNKKKAQLDDMNKKKEETAKFVSDIKSKNKKIKLKRPQYEQYSTLFHTKAEVEGLYQTLSEFAAMNNLVISKIEKKKIAEVTKADAIASVSKNKGKKKKKKKTQKREVKNIAYYKIPVDFEITGNFLGYIKFKRQLSLSQKTLNFDNESIKVLKKGDSTGAIKVNGTLTIVGLADEFFRKITYIIFMLFFAFAGKADNHDKEQNIVERAKEVNQKIKEQQANKKSNISSEINNEEPLPLNDPFVGDGTLGGSSGGVKLIAETEEQKKKLSVFNYKLVGIIEGDGVGFASLVDESGEVINVGLNEELTQGVRLIGISTKEVMFERGEDSLVVINFKNQIIERNN